MMTEHYDHRVFNVERIVYINVPQKDGRMFISIQGLKKDSCKCSCICLRIPSLSYIFFDKFITRPVIGLVRAKTSYYGQLTVGTVTVDSSELIPSRKFVTARDCNVVQLF
jgi:hypothetical protein